MNSAVFEDLPSQTKLALEALASEVKSARPLDVAMWSIDASNLPRQSTDTTVVQEVASWAGKSKACLYYFISTSSTLNLSLVRRTFEKAKIRDSRVRAYSRVNNESSCFYVGSSQSIVKRLKEHLGYGSASTYALQLNRWAGRPLSIGLDLVCAKYEDSTSPEVIQALEDNLWKRLSPMFGRQGRK